jgi:hypothetical protein
MKLILLPAAFFAVLSTLNAQITINGNDLPQPNNSYAVMNAIDADNNDPENTGAGITWDYTGLQDLTALVEDYVSVSSAPFSYQFLFSNPFNSAYIADVAVKRFDQEIGTGITFEDYYEFYRTDNIYGRVGVGATINSFPIPAINNPIDTLFGLPLNYGAIDTNYSELLFEIPGLATYLNKQTRRYSCDGWGTLLTPYGQFETLRVRMEIDARDSISIPELMLEQAFDRPSVVEYSWYAEGEGVPVLKIITTAGIPTSVQYKTEEIVENVVNSSVENISLYPVPASNTIQISANGNHAGAMWIVADASGKIVLQGQSNGYNLNIDISSLASGTYNFVLMDRGSLVNKAFIKE